MKVINLREAQRMIGEIVAEVGKEHTYQRISAPGSTCLYWHPGGERGDSPAKKTAKGQPGCIVGRLLYNAGVSPQGIHALDGRGSIASACYLLPEHGVRLTDRAVQYLQQVQKEQDSGHTWSESAAYARGWLESSEFTGSTALDV